MKKIQIKYHLEKGQVLPLVVLMFFVIIGMVALILDGGSIMSNRRTAQAAADAGALAGAQRACLGKTDAKTVAEDYAITRNNATSATATVFGKQVTVIASVEHPSFFAKIFGEQTLTASAEATAGCFGVSGKGAVPVGWLCLQNNTEGHFDTAYGCQMQTLSWKLIGPLMDPNWNPPSERVASVSISDYGGGNTINYIKSGTSIVDSVTGKIPPNQIYIIMDGAKICSDFLCDFNKDGKNEINPEGNRGYLDLITYYKTHTWLSGKGGTDKGFFKKEVGPFEGQVVMLPVYNYLCNGDPQKPLCLAGGYDSPPWPIFNGVDDYSAIHPGNKVNYHIIAFAPFYVSCADSKGNCPGYIYAQTKDSTLKSNEPILEGYFLTDVDVSIDSTENCAINLGNCTVSLTK